MVDTFRYEVFKRTGFFVTESSEHFSACVPWFIKRDRPDLLERFDVPLDKYIRRCENQIAGWETLRASLEDDAHDLTVERSVEFGSSIFHSMETGQPSVIYDDVANEGLIDDLPSGCMVEVSCVVDRNGVQPTRIGALPPQLAALIQPTSTCSDWSSRRSSPATGSTCTTPPCSTPTRRPSWTWTRFGQWSTSCWPPTATGSQTRCATDARPARLTTALGVSPGPTRVVVGTPPGTA